MRLTDALEAIRISACNLAIGQFIENLGQAGGIQAVVYQILGNLAVGCLRDAIAEGVVDLTDGAIVHREQMMKGIEAKEFSGGAGCVAVEVIALAGTMIVGIEGIGAGGNLGQGRQQGQPITDWIEAVLRRAVLLGRIERDSLVGQPINAIVVPIGGSAVEFDRLSEIAIGSPLIDVTGDLARRTRRRQRREEIERIVFCRRLNAIRIGYGLDIGGVVVGVGYIYNSAFRHAAIPGLKSETWSTHLQWLTSLSQI